MAKQSNREIYKPDTLITGREYWTLTNEDGKTITLDIAAIDGFLSGGDGIQNYDGTYTWVKYAEDEFGNGMVNEPTVDTLYIGLAYNKTSNIESTDPEDYTWGLIDGENYWIDEFGVYHYTWIKYADSPTSGMSDSPFGKAYIGMAFDKHTPVESTNYVDYQWTLRKGARYESNQNNLVRVIDIPEEELTATTSAGIAAWINTNGIEVRQDEIILFNIILKDVTPDNPILDPTKLLVLSYSNVTYTTAYLSWEDNGDNAITRFLLVYKNLDNLIIKTSTLTAIDTAAIISSLSDNSRYEVYLIAYDSSNNEKQSNTVAFTTPQIFIPSTPNLTLTNYDQTTADFVWGIEPSFNADVYELYQDGVRVYFGPNTTYHQAGLAADTEYEFYVIAYSNSVPSNQSIHTTFTTLAASNPPLTKPVISLVSKGTDYIKVTVDIPALEWNRIVQSGSKLYYRIFGSTVWNEQNYDIVNNEGFASALNDNTVYQFRVVLSDGSVVSPYSDTLSVTTDQIMVYDISMNVTSSPVEGTPTTPDDKKGFLSITGGSPSEDITVLMGIEPITDPNTYLANLKATTDGTSYHVIAENGTSPISVPIPITLDLNGNYYDIPLELSGLYDGAGDTLIVKSKFEITARSGGNLPGTAIYYNFYITSIAPPSGGGGGAV